MKKDMKFEWMTIRWKNVFIGVGISTVVTIALTGAFAGLVSGQVMEERNLAYIALGIVMLSSFFGAGIAGGRGQVLDQLGVGFLYWVVLLAINAILFGGNLDGLWPTLAVIFGGCGAALLVLHRGKRTSKRSRRRYRNR